MQITVIGGSGFLGSHISDALTRKGYKVIIFDKKNSKWKKKKSTNGSWKYIKFKLFKKSNKGESGSI